MIERREFHFKGGWPEFRKFLEPSCRLVAEELRLFPGIHDGHDDWSPPERHVGFRLERRGRQRAVLSVYTG